MEKAMKRSMLATAITLSACMVAGTVSAAPLNLTNYTYAPGKSLKTTDSSNSSNNFNGQGGQFTGTYDSNAFVTFCADLAQSFNFNTLYNDYVVVDGVTAFGYNKSLDIDRVMSYFLDTGYPTNNVESAVAQATIWEVLYENSSYGFTSGNMLISSLDGATQTALTTFDSTFWSSLSSITITHHFDQLFSEKNQDFLIEGELPPPPPVPEPGMFALLGLGLVGLSSTLRRKQA
jgi:hypothetical protein